MTVLITGGTGFVGLNIAESLALQGRPVVLFDIGAPPDEAMRELSGGGTSVHFVQGDIRDRAALDAAITTHRVEQAVHAAVITAGAEREARDASTIVEVNMLGTVAMLEAALQYGLKRVVYLSSSSVYGDNSFDDSELEEAATPALPNTLYSISKYAGERMALRYRDLRGLDVVCARLSAAFGPWERDTGFRDTLSPPFRATLAALRGDSVVLPRPVRRDWVYGRDVAAAVAILLERARFGHLVYNVGPGAEFATSDWCALLAERFPDFAWAIDGGADTTLWGDRDRRPLAVDRLISDLGYTPKYRIVEAFDDYMSWLDRHPGFVDSLQRPLPTNE